MSTSIEHTVSLEPLEAWVLERYRSGAESVDHMHLRSSLALGMLAAMLGRPHDRDAALDEYLSTLPDGVARQVKSALFAADITHTPARARGRGGVPALPDEVLQGMSPEQWYAARSGEAGRPAGEWIDQYVAYSNRPSPMTHPLFPESAALWLVSTVVARRLVVQATYGAVYPNLFIAWIAPTALWRKSTTLKVARDLARRVCPHLMAAQESTPEALLCDMAGREPVGFDAMAEEHQEAWRRARDFCAQRGMALDEMSGLLAMAGKEYSAGLIEALLRFYDCDPLFVRSTRSAG